MNIIERLKKLNPFRSKSAPSAEMEPEYAPELLESLAEEVVSEEPETVEEIPEIPPSLPPHRMVDVPDLVKAEADIHASLKVIDGLAVQNKELQGEVRRLALCLKAHREALWTYISSVVKVARGEEPNLEDFSYFEDLRVISEFNSRVLDIAERLGLAVSDLFVGIYGGSIEDKQAGLGLNDDQVLALVDTSYKVDQVLERVDEREKTLEEVIEAFQKREAVKAEKEKKAAKPRKPRTVRKNIKKSKNIKKGRK